MYNSLILYTATQSKVNMSLFYFIFLLLKNFFFFLKNILDAKILCKVFEIKTYSYIYIIHAKYKYAFFSSLRVYYNCTQSRPDMEIPAAREFAPLPSASTGINFMVSDFWYISLVQNF